MASVGIIGLGYVGLPLAVAFAQEGCEVVAVDVDARKVEAVGAGDSYVEDVSAEDLAQFVDNLGDMNLLDLAADTRVDAGKGLAIVPAADGGSTTYRVVLGAFSSHERAAGAAKMLLDSKTLSDVNIVPLPPRSARQ